MEHSVPSQSLVTGFDTEKRSITWTIGNFHVVRKDLETINSQKIEFAAGDSMGIPSQWSVCLEQEENSEGEQRWIGIYLKLESPNSTDDIFETTYSEIQFTAKNQQGEIIKNYESGPTHIATEFDEYLDFSGCGCDEFIDADDVGDDYQDGNLVIDITFKLYTPSQAKATKPLEAIMAEFQVKFSDQLRKDLSGLLENPIPGTDLKIVSKDKQEFYMHRDTLAARSEVFAGMLRADMTEAKSGVLELTDISGKALKVFLNFVNAGSLRPEWSQTDVIVELTNAAGKYQLQDLLQFLDVTMGKVCKLENVVALAKLARLLSLKGAEEELMTFARREGVGSLDNFLQMWNEQLPETDDDDDSGEPSAKKQKLK